MDYKDICLQLAYSETEQQVIEILTSVGMWEDERIWKHFGGNENNFATIGNQQSRPESALVEKLVNSVDAVLMSECLKRRCDPESEEAPRDSRSALREFFEISEGRLTGMSPTLRTRLSQRICLVATGTKKNPCYSIIDAGEGQSPKKMPDTLLSLGRSNKLRIPFVQGKFNMGGTGVFQFCGKCNIQLIVSKRHPEVAEWEADGTKKHWSFTVIRREDPGHGVRSSTYRYLAPGGEVLWFDAEELMLLPGDYPNPYGAPMKWGTFVKLYEYQMQGGLKTYIVFDLYNRLSLLMAEVALPIRMYERRAGYSGHTPETTLSGLTIRLEEDRRDNIEDGFPTSSFMSVQGQQMRVSIFAFKKDQAKKYRKDEGVIFLVNGQTHAHLATRFFTQQAVGMAYLEDSLLVMVDCSDIEGRAREDLFMNSRDRLRSGELRHHIEQELEDLLRSHPGLRELRERRRREELEQQVDNSKPLEDIIEQVLKRAPTLARLFKEGLRVPNPFKSGHGGEAKSYVGKRFPTYFLLVDKFPPDKPKQCPQNNSRFRVQYETDVENEYFVRESDPGKFTLHLDNTEMGDDYTMNLWNGIATLNISLPLPAKVGSVLTFSSAVTDVNRIEALEEDFHVLICEPASPGSGGNGRRKPAPSDNKGKKAHKPDRFDLPKPILVRKEAWEKHHFDAYSALRVVADGEGGNDFFVNVDNIYLATERKAQSKADPKILEIKYATGMVIIGLALLRDWYDNQANTQEDEDTHDVYKMISNFTKVISPFFLPMVDSLGDLQIEKVAELYDAE
jgi:regulator of replication initiation timing